ncbi:MAG: sigma-54 dependent transcriptional regulator [Candidatus Zixiibacteriota bacterium]
MKTKTAILLGEQFATDTIEWSELGQVVTQLPDLLRIVRERIIDVVLIDANRSDLSRQIALRIRQNNPLTEIWKITDHDDQLTDEPDWIDGVLVRSAGLVGLEQKLDSIFHSRELLEQYEIISRSPKMKRVAETIERIAVTDVAVLIVGASGSGKELVARAIHRQSRRRDKTFVAINCGALAEGVLESELFGHEKGAFTGSVGRREGLFHKANGGTIFLDEVGEMSPTIQVKLLRVLEDGSYYRVGSSSMEHTDVRVVAATNRDLAEAISERQFREDLYFRIGVVKIILPPLLERKGDIVPLLRHFWREHPKVSINDGAVDLLLRYDWPGNVRQLRNFSERMLAFKPTGVVDITDVELFLHEQHAGGGSLPVATGKTVEESGQELIYRAILSLGSEVRMLRDLITSHLPPESPGREGEDSVFKRGLTMDEMERRMIESALTEHSGNRKEVARKLGIGERTLYRKLKQYKLG